MRKMRWAAILLLGLTLPGMAADDASSILNAGGDDVVEKVCESGSASVEAGSDAIVSTARSAATLLRPVMECLYRKVTPEDFGGMVDSAVETLNAAGE